MYSLISFATQWGSKHGGINSFNADFLTAFGVAYHLSVEVICIVASATQEEIEDARNAHVSLLPLPYLPKDQLFTSVEAQAAIDELKSRSVSFNPSQTVWLGHDRITGDAANAAASIAGGRSALIHHMSYGHYESYAENSKAADEKIEGQVKLFRQAGLVLAVGPILRDALTDQLGASTAVHMLIPGLADIETRNPPKTFTAFLSGRFSEDTARIKQVNLGIAGFSSAQRKARHDGMPESLCNSPKLLLRGVDFEARLASPSRQQREADPETDLKKYAEEHACAVVNLQVLPYTQDRKKLFADLSSASVALMPSWHEGFGLAAWEAIAAGVPVIISKNSGVYRLLEEELPGAGPGCVYPIEVSASVDYPFFRQEDLTCLVSELTKVANNTEKARRKAVILRDLLGKYSWAACAEEAARIFGWPLQKGSIQANVVTDNYASYVSIVPQPISLVQGSPLHIPLKQWQPGCVLADSQLLRAEEALVPFDVARQPELDILNAWLDDTRWPQAVRLITGAGGLGKTRLALELCQQRLRSNWHAGFLDADLDAKDMAGGWQALRNFNQPLLIVIDYAETRQAALLALIKSMAHVPGNQSVRLLLLARDGGEWWDNLPGKDPTCESLLSGYATSGPFCLPALHEVELDRREAYQKALHVFAEAIGATAPNVIPELTGDHFGRPLYLQMAALLALYGERQTTAQGLTKALLNHERRYWRRLFNNSTLVDPELYAELLLALTTLAGGFSSSKLAQSYWEIASGNSISNADFNLLFQTLAPLYPGKQGLQAVRPDLLGEALVAHAFLRSETANTLDAVLSNKASQPIRHHALTVLARLSDQHHELREMLVETLARNFSHCYLEVVMVSVESQNCLPALGEAAFARLLPSIKSQIAGLLNPLLSEESVQLAQLGCLVSEYLSEKCRQKLQRKPWSLEITAEHALSLRDLGVSLMRLGRTEEALSSSKEALEIYQRLVKKDLNRYEPEYAGALNNYANHIAEIGQYGDAHTHAKLVLECYERLAKKNPDQHEPNLAMALHNYSIRSSDAGQYDDAHTYARLALESYERLARKDPDRSEPDYARALDNYAIRLGDTGQYSDALIHAKLGLESYKRLAEKFPDRYEPSYALAMHNYANHLSNVGHYGDAHTYVRLALGIYKRLTQKNAMRFAHVLFGNYCLANFLGWLDVNIEKSDDLAELGSISPMIPPLHQALSQIYGAFVLAILASELTARGDHFKRVIRICSDSSLTNNEKVQAYWLCAVAWCATYQPSLVENLDWQSSWYRYRNRLQGRLPQWMQDIAQRMVFKWPM